MPAHSKKVRLFRLVSYLMGEAYVPKQGKEGALEKELAGYLTLVDEPYQDALRDFYFNSEDSPSGYDAQLVHHGKAAFKAGVSARHDQPLHKIFEDFVKRVRVPRAQDGWVGLPALNKAVFGSEKSTVITRNAEQLGVTIEQNAVSLDDAKKIVQMKREGAFA
jgi:hypothetical protein